MKLEWVIFHFLYKGVKSFDQEFCAVLCCTDGSSVSVMPMVLSSPHGHGHPKANEDSDWKLFLTIRIDCASHLTCKLQLITDSQDTVPYIIKRVFQVSRVQVYEISTCTTCTVFPRCYRPRSLYRTLWLLLLSPLVAIALATIAIITYYHAIIFLNNPHFFTEYTQCYV